MVILVGAAILALFIISCSNPTHSSYTVTFDPNGGTLTGGGNTVVVATGSPVQEPDAPTRSGYTFDGWYLKGSEEKYDFSLPIIADITLEARWTAASGGTPTPTPTPTPPPTPTSYTVTYHALVDGQESTDIEVPPSTPMQSGSILRTPATPKYDSADMTFVGWSTSENEYSALPADYTVRGPVELWAVFITKTKSQMTSDDGMLMYDFDENDGGYKVKGTATASDTVVIPSTINGAPVVAIDAQAFSGSQITAINLSGATNLKTIEDEAFAGTDISKLTIPGNVEYVGQYIVQGCDSLTSLTIEEGVKALGNYAFFGATAIQSLTIPGSVETVGGRVVQECTSLAEITLEEGIKSLSMRSFYGAAVKSIKIPSTITDIPAYCFEASAIERIKLHDGITSIGEGAFFNCSGLTELTIPRSVKSIGQSILQIGSGESDNWTTDSNASIKVVIEEGASGLSASSFWGSPISSISIPSTIDTIPDYCFSNSTLSHIEIKGSIKTIGISAFYNCSNLSSIDLTGVESIGISAFAHTGITSIHIPASVATVGSHAFENGEMIIGSSGGYQFDEGDSLTVTFGEGFDGLTTGSFYGAPISSITIPESVTIIPMSCFYYATMLTSVTLHDGITEIQNNAFFDADIKEIKLPANLRRIGDFAFDSCALTELTLPEGLVSIGQNAFRSNQITGTLVIPASVTTIGKKAFLGANISDLEFGEGTELSIGSEAFASMRDLRDVTLPASLISLDIGAFSYSSNHSDNGNVGLYSLTVQNDDPDNIKLTGTSAKAIYCTLYVPDTEGVVDKYKASTTNWCAQNRFDAANIEPVSDKPTS